MGGDGRHFYIFVKVLKVLQRQKVALFCQFYRDEQNLMCFSAAVHCNVTPDSIELTVIDFS